MQFDCRGLLRRPSDVCGTKATPHETLALLPEAASLRCWLRLAERGAALHRNHGRGGVGFGPWSLLRRLIGVGTIRRTRARAAPSAIPATGRPNATAATPLTSRSAAKTSRRQLVRRCGRIAPHSAAAQNGSARPTQTGSARRGSARTGLQVTSRCAAKVRGLALRHQTLTLGASLCDD